MAADGKDKTALTEKIAELEALLLAQREASRTETRLQAGEAGVPILDELIDGDDYPELPFGEDAESPFEDEPELPFDDGPEMAHTAEADARLEQIADELEQKLTKELDEIVTLLKTNMRESILNELQTMLDNETDKKTEG